MVKYWHFCLLSATSCLLLSTDNIDARVLSSIPSESSNHHSHIHTLSHLDLSNFSPNLFLKQSDKQSYLTASVCFITDAGNCSGDKFGNLETPGGTNRPDYDTIPEQCRDAGYTKTSCPAGQHLVNPCPSDNRYYEPKFVIFLIMGLDRLVMVNMKNVNEMTTALVKKKVIL